MDKRVNNHKSSILNYDANVLSFLIYFIIAMVGFIPFLNYIIFALPLIIYVMEKKSKFVRDNMLQALVISFGSSIFYLLCLAISFISKPRCNSSLSLCFGSSIIHKMFSMFGSIRWMFAGFIFVICLVLSLRAYNYENYKLNYIGKSYDKISKFLNKLLGVHPIEGEETKQDETSVVEQVIAEEPVVEETESIEVSVREQLVTEDSIVEKVVDEKKEEVYKKTTPKKASSKSKKASNSSKKTTSKKTTTSKKKKKSSSKKKNNSKTKKDIK